MKTLLIYTRTPLESDIYDPKLAFSLHLALLCEGGFKALNHNSGVFFARATENEDGSLNPKSLKSPYAFALNEGGYCVVAIRTESDGSKDSEGGCVIVARTFDFISYEEIGTIKLCDTEIESVRGKLCQSCGKYMIFYKTEGVVARFEFEDIFSLKGEHLPAPPESRIDPFPVPALRIEGACPSCLLEISDEVADKLYKKLVTPENISVDVPDTIEASSLAELSLVKALAHYSDGSQDEKRIDWDLSGVDFSKPGSYEIKGTLHQDNYPFPVAINRADPCIAKWGDKYYYIATDDSSHEQNMYIRCADDIPGLVTAPEVKILDAKTYPDIGGLLWAPEFHEIDGRLYIFHAATPGEFFREESHLRVLRDGGDPMDPSDWSKPERVTLKDGSDLAEAGKTITLDMTCFLWEGEYYVAWSQRQFIPKDLGAWLYFAKLDRNDPWRLASDPIVLSKPDYGWANNHTFVDEGPFALIRGDKLYLSFSSAAVDSTYVVGMLTIEKGKDPLVASNWTKSNYPLLTSRSVEGQFGTGHNAYVTDDDGKVWNTYHARPGVNGPRSTGIRRVHFDVYGEPVLDMTEELDIKPELKNVKTTLIVK